DYYCLSFDRSLSAHWVF
nr:immunoglobulin light chain junction region [Macaca mulatta]MOY05391.1 immunoglobulin light chain junction region [Macaca mulatta]MOY06491.1 immunoglobulin light chain junction region [Macaca mulatta]MOY07813.1 immunoglobulin light chain junction region [Macaca mulatta]MOY07914.1 immunoglobulin light chain junction region [Macaca mulatta]